MDEVKNTEPTEKKKWKPRNRNRKHFIGFYMNDEEYLNFCKKLTASDFRSQQAYLLYLAGVNEYTPNEITAWHTIDNAIAKLTDEFNHIGVNINQLARKANAKGKIPELKELQQMRKELRTLEGRTEKLWQSLRLMIASARTQEP